MSPITYLVLRRVPDETLAVGEGDVRRRRAVTHVVGDDLDPAREKISISNFLTRQSSSSSSSSIARVIIPIIAFPALGRDEISRGRRRNAARVATSTLDPSTTDRTNEKHTQKNTLIARSLARVPRRITADHRASIVALAAIRIIACIIDRHRGEEKRPPIHPSRAKLERTDRVARHRRTNMSCRDRSRSRDLQPYS